MNAIKAASGGRRHSDGIEKRLVLMINQTATVFGQCRKYVSKVAALGGGGEAAALSAAYKQAHRYRQLPAGCLDVKLQSRVGTGN